VFKWILALGLFMAASSARAEPASVDDYMGQPRHRPDATIAYGPSPSQVAELFLPKAKRSRPVVVLIHGGCFLAQFEGLAQTSAIAADLAGRGYAVWNIDYRKLGEAGAGYPGTFEDVATAVDRLRGEAPKYNLDLKRVIAVGHSAGGHLALWAAARGRLPAGSPLRTAEPLAISAVVSLAGIGDLKGQAKAFALPCGDDTLDRLIDTAHRKAPYADTSPAELLPIAARITMVHGAYDAVMPPYTGLAFAQAVRKSGGKAEVVTLADAGHFDVVIPTTAAWAQVAGIVAGEIKALPH
jgi:acetyl esterase/lipase